MFIVRFYNDNRKKLKFEILRGKSMINFIAVVICGAFAVWYGINDEVGYCILESALALMNLPFAILWIVNLF